MLCITALGDSVRQAQKVAYGAAGLVALRLALRFALGGPLGIVLTGAAAVSLIAYLVQHRSEVSKKLDRAHRLIDETRPRFDEIQGAYRSGRHSEAERNLMVEGLLKGFLEQLDE